MCESFINSLNKTQLWSNTRESYQPQSNKTYVDLNKTYVGEAKFISKKQWWQSWTLNQQQHVAAIRVVHKWQHHFLAKLDSSLLEAAFCSCSTK